MDDYLSHSTLRLLVIGVAAIAAISMGAATIASTVDVDSNPGLSAPDDVDGGLENEGGQSGGEQIGGRGDESSSYDPDLTSCNDTLNSTPGTLGYFLAIGLVLYLIKRRYSTGIALLGAYGIAPVVLVAYFLLTDCVQGDRGQVREATGELGGGGGSSSIVATPEISPIWLVGVFALFFVAAAAVIIRASGDQTVVPDGDDEGSAGDTDVSDLADAAGAAADRLEKHNADVDNAVYRAWWEMVSLLEVPNPDSATPGEFAEAAIDLGMSEDDVGKLTELFEEVRYGERDPESREERAIEVFRSIEAEYGTEGGSALDADAVDDTTEENDGR